jgi:hypothetical protein
VCSVCLRAHVYHACTHAHTCNEFMSRVDACFVRVCVLVCMRASLRVYTTHTYTCMIEVCVCNEIHVYAEGVGLRMHVGLRIHDRCVHL